MTYARFWTGAARARADNPARTIAEERMLILDKYRGYALSVDVCLIPDQRLLKLFVFEGVNGSYESNLWLFAGDKLQFVNFRSTCDFCLTELAVQVIVVFSGEGSINSSEWCCWNRSSRAIAIDRGDLSKSGDVGNAKECYKKGQ